MAKLRLFYQRIHFEIEHPIFVTTSSPHFSERRSLHQIHTKTNNIKRGLNVPIKVRQDYKNQEVYVIPQDQD
jgi:hypothetical protein